MLFRAEHLEGLGAGFPTLSRYGAGAAGLIAWALFAGVLGQRLNRTHVRLAALAALLVTIPVWIAGRTLNMAHPTPPNREHQGSRPSVVLIVLDTVWADHLESYGYDKNTMLQLERFVRTHTVRAERSVSTSSWSLPSHASMFTGLFPVRHGAHHAYLDEPATASVSMHGVRDEVPTLAEILQTLGYWTVGVSANYAVLTESLGLGRGFDLYETMPRSCYELRRRTPWRIASDHIAPLAMFDRFAPFNDCGFFGLADRYRSAEEITDRAIDVVSASRDEPLFLFLNYFDAHEPHHRRERRFTERREDTRALREAVWVGEGSLEEHERIELIDYYDSELTYLDTHLDRLLTELSRRAGWDEMLVIITSDHGESLGEHGLITHGTSLYSEVLDIPFFVKRHANPTWGPASPPDSIQLFQPVDIFPTVLDYLGAAVPSRLDGFAWGRGRTEARAWSFVDRDKARIAPQLFDKESQSVERGGWKLIASSDGTMELYDLRKDPREHNNVAQQEPEMAETMKALLWPRVTYVESGRDDSAPDEDFLERLRSLGYVR